MYSLHSSGTCQQGKAHTGGGVKPHAALLATLLGKEEAGQLCWLGSGREGLGGRCRGGAGVSAPLQQRWPTSAVPSGSMTWSPHRACPSQAWSASTPSGQSRACGDRAHAVSALSACRPHCRHCRRCRRAAGVGWCPRAAPRPVWGHCSAARGTLGGMRFVQRPKPGTATLPTSSRKAKPQPGTHDRLPRAAGQPTRRHPILKTAQDLDGMPQQRGGRRGDDGTSRAARGCRLLTFRSRPTHSRTSCSSQRRRRAW